MLISCYDPPYRVEAENVIFDGQRVAVHRPLGFVLSERPYFRPYGWTVTHKRTGLVIVIFRRKRNALRLARVLEKMPVLDYNQKTAMRSKTLKAIAYEHRRQEDYARFLRKLSRSHVGEAHAS